VTSALPMRRSTD